MGSPSGQHWYDVEVSSLALRFSQERGAGRSDRTGRVPSVSSLYGHGTCRITGHRTALSREGGGRYTISARGGQKRAVRTSFGPVSAGTVAPRGSVFSRGRRGRSDALKFWWPISPRCKARCACGRHQPRVAYVKLVRTRCLRPTAGTPAPTRAAHLEMQRCLSCTCMEQSSRTLHQRYQQQQSGFARRPLQPPATTGSRVDVQRADARTPSRHRCGRPLHTSHRRDMRSPRGGRPACVTFRGACAIQAESRFTAARRPWPRRWSPRRRAGLP
jgi:hypothetical protein